MTEEIIPKVSKGQLFKEQYGYSKSMKRVMQKHGLDPNVYSDSMNEYRSIRKKTKLREKLAQKDKHALAKANRKAPKDKTNKKKPDEIKKKK